MKGSNLLTRRRTGRTVWTTVLLAMLLVASLTAATPGRLMLIPGITSSLAHANAQGISAPAPASATSPKQEQMQEQGQSKQPGLGLGLGQPATPLERVLNKDGTLELNTGYSGSVSVDPKGWRMEIGPGGKPRFVKSDEQQQAAPKPRSTTSLFSPLAAGNLNQSRHLVAALVQIAMYCKCSDD